MNNPNQKPSPALRMDSTSSPQVPALSINCVFVYASLFAANCNLLIIARMMANESEGRTDSLQAHYLEYLLLMRLILLIHIIRRTPDGLFEIARTPGEGDKHTLYFKGLYGDIFSQMTRNDAQLITQAVIEQQHPNMRVEMTTSGISQNIGISTSSMTGFFNTLHDTWFAKRTLSVTPLLTVAVLFTFTQCGIIGGGKKKGEAPWLLLGSGINSNTPSVDSPSNGNSSGGSGGSGGSSLVPVVGMYFLHPDHLGSITMITDGRGNVIAGGNNGGKSHISYKPYCEIHRTDSSGPDITRFKNTGQEEDKESGLLYYKARYYGRRRWVCDRANGRKMIGRFLQADSVVMPESTFGMYAADGKTNIGKDLSKGAGVMAFAIGLNAIINEPGLNDEQRAQRLSFCSFIGNKS